MEKRDTFDRMALGCISHLEAFSEVRTVLFQGNDPATQLEFISWERKNSPWKLPIDLKSFYSTFNGINLAWSVEIIEKIETIGEMRLNKIDSIVKCNTEYFVQEKLPDEVSPPTPRNSQLFVLDSSCPLGNIVLLYRQNSTTSTASPNAPTSANPLSHASVDDPEIWLLDNTATLTYISRNFTQYMRLMVVHLGIHGWQGVFMDNCWPVSTQTWMNIFCKERLIIDRHYRNEKQEIDMKK
jgi:hypothetical protein